MKKISKWFFLTLLFGLLLIVPENVYGGQLLAYETLYAEGINIIGSIDFYGNDDGKIEVIVRMPFNKVYSYNDFEIYAVNEKGKIFVRESATKDDGIIRDGSDASYYYTFKTVFEGGKKIKFGAYGYKDQKQDDEILIKDAYEVTLPSGLKNTSKDIGKINVSKKIQKFSGTTGKYQSFNGKCGVYKISLKSDAALSVSGYKSQGGFIAVYDSLDAAKQASAFYAVSNGVMYENGDNIENLGLKKGTYYLVVHNSDEVSYEFEAKLTAIVHAKAKWTIKEGSINQAFPQNTVLNVSFEITNKDATAILDSDVYWTAPGRGANNPVKVSKNGRKCEFTFKTGNAAGVETLTLYIKEFNAETGANLSPYTLEIMTGVSLADLKTEVGSDYIYFPSFQISDFGDGEKAKIAVYLKDGKNWVKKFTVEAGSTETKKISKLKAGTKYEYKIEVTKTLSNGKKSQTSQTYKVKTGPDQKPVIASAKISNYKVSKGWMEGHYDAGGVWHDGYAYESSSYTLTITLKSALSGCKGLNYAGKNCKGTGTKFSFKCTGKPVTSVKVRGYTDDTYGGYTAYSEQKKIS